MFYTENNFYFDIPTDINIIRCGKRLNAVNHSYGPVVRENFWLIFIKDGHGKLYINGQTFSLKREYVMCTFPNHNFHYTFDSTASIYWICFNSAFSESILSTIDLSIQSPTKKVDNFTEVERIFNNIYDLSCSNLQRDKYQTFASVYQLFALLTGNDKNTIQSRNYTHFAIRYMDNNYAEDMHIKDIADSLHLEKTYFSKLFKKETGITPSEYLSNLRIQKACRLLRDYSITISETAASVGINDAFYFSRKFKNAMGVSPNKYRKEYK